MWDKPVREDVKQQEEERLRKQREITLAAIRDRELSAKNAVPPPPDFWTRISKILSNRKRMGE